MRKRRLITTSFLVTRNGEDVEVQISGRSCPAEPDVGIFSSYVELESATVDGKEFDITPDEELRAQEVLDEALDAFKEEDSAREDDARKDRLEAL